ncbi:MAG: PBP1A family penicillin-binding protein [Deltaproteobacteria bacterium]|nr:PBP1A family penicillin-binding protein [Deltaproteobacteria bacterium]
MRRWKAKKPERRGFFLLVLAAAAAGCLAGAAGALALWLTSDLPALEQLDGQAPPAITRVVSADNVVLDEWYAQRRLITGLDHIPKYLKLAVMATEDQNFYSHFGVDVKGLARAVVHNVMAMDYVEGASTITQQLAKNLFLSPKKTLTRKLREAVLALQLERRYTKDEILERYLNQIYYGSGAYGASMAARTFFGKSLSDLTLAQCALIAGLPKSPSRYSPLVDPQKAENRRNIVLFQMRSLGWISEEEYRAAREEPVQVADAPEGRRAGYFVEEVRRELLPLLGASTLYKEGLTIRTTLNWRLQQAAEKAVALGLSRVRDRAAARGMDPANVQAALVCLDVSTGAILAMVGGEDHVKTPFNRATQALRQPGSAFKPLVYAVAVAHGMEQDASILDAPVVFPSGSDQRDWTPENYDRAYEGEISLRRALADSRNIPAVRLAHHLSPTAVVDLARDLGISSGLSANLSLALGTSEVTLEELTGAYAAFANQGRWIKPHGVLEAVGRQEQVLFRARPEKRAVLSPEVSAVLVDMLKAVVKEGTGRGVLSLGVPLAGKTGTTADCRDAWFVGFSPKIAVGVWVGTDDGSSLGPAETGARAALPIWKEFMAAAVAEGSHGDFPLPSGLVRKKIDPRTGKPDENGVYALFRK